MPPEVEFSSIRWTERFLRADAEEPVGAMLMVLSQIRKNQWVLLEWKLHEEVSRYYPAKKGEVLPHLERASFETTVVRALNLEEGPHSQTVRERQIEQFTESRANLLAARGGSLQPWAQRKVLVDGSGRPIAIGVPVVRRGVGGEGAAFARRPIGVQNPAFKVDTVQTERAPLPEFPRGYSIVRVFYGTDRSKRSDGGGYSNQRDPNGALHYGVCDVTIPRDHKLAKLESPRWWKFEFHWNPAKHITVQHTDELPEQRFLSLVQTRISEGVDRSAFVFIHGFNVSFEDGARRTAQLSYDLGFDGSPILYSWPSASHLGGYLADEATIEWTKPHLERFLSQIASQCGARTLHVIAHSMGNRALVKILGSLCASISPQCFNQIVLTAPDIDAGEFMQLAASMQPAGERITLYASSNDKAIGLSKKIHEYPRAGESGSDIVIVQGLDTIDASGVDTSFVGHSYFAEKRTVLSDLYYLLKEGKAPSERHSLERRTCDKGSYWAFRP